MADKITSHYLEVSRLLHTMTGRISCKTAFPLKLNDHPIYMSATFQMGIFPRVLAEIIADYCATWELTLMAREHHIEMISKYPEYICENPRACDFIRECVDDAKLGCNLEQSWGEITSNPGTADLLRDHPEKVDLRYMGMPGNTSPYAIELFRSKINECGLDALEWLHIFGNPAFIDIIEDNLDKANWHFLSQNSAARHILEKYPDKIVWKAISSCAWAIDILEANQDKLDWETLSTNRAAIHLLRKDPTKVNWKAVNVHGLVELLREFPDRIDWYELSKCDVPLVIPFIRENLDKVFWTEISANSIMIDILRENPDKINWIYLSGNSAAWDMLLTQPELIDWESAGTQLEIFVAVRPVGLVDELSI